MIVKRPYWLPHFNAANVFWLLTKVGHWLAIIYGYAPMNVQSNQARHSPKQK